MNGFRELHAHKIMHRDFKLANIFLNDDNLIIGDFGFAKSGADMASTKLGSPITMAPELLNAGSVVRYTNKADLWSIGVCFFQTIFGKPPFNAKNLNELKTLVKTKSGKNLVFPSNPPTTEECKEILRRLIEPDPKKRIEWTEFFQHSLFFKHENDEQKVDMKSSVMFRNHEDKVNQLFQKNQNKKQTEIELVDPLEIQLEMNDDDEDPEAAAAKKEEELKEKSINQARQRYTHEKKIIVFIMHTCRKLRNLAKQRGHLEQASNSLMFSGLLLLKKGIVKNEEAINTIKHQINSFRLPKFDYFLETNNCKKIMKELSKDNKLYYTLLSHLQKKLQSEIGVSDPRAKDLYTLSINTDATLKELQPELAREMSYLVEFHAQKGHTLVNEIKRELSIGLCDLFLSVHSEKEFVFMKQGIPFDWHQFETNFNMNFVNNTLQRALEN